MDTIAQLDLYQQELQEDLSVDESTMREKQMLLPSTRHKWVGRLIRTKHHKTKLEAKKRELIRNNFDAAKQSRESAILELSDKALLERARRHTSVNKIDDEMQQVDLMIEYLEKVEKILSSMGFDIKNLLEIIKLETT